MMKYLFIPLLALTFIGCGGGGSDDSGDNPPANAPTAYVFSYPPSPQDVGEETSSIEGVIRNALTQDPVSSVAIRLSSSSTTTSATDGSYSFDNVANNTYQIEFLKNGYMTARYSIDASETSSYTLDPLLFIESSVTGNSTIGGIIKDAHTGEALRGTTLQVREGLNNKTGNVINTANISGSSYSLNLAKGYYTLELSKDGYMPEFYNTYVAQDEQTKDLIISPELSEGEIRVVLTWGATPSDLDSHLVKYVNNQLQYHVYFDEEEAEQDGALLDTDDTSSYGPETITFSASTNAQYKYFVHDYTNDHLTNSGALARSGAKVTLYKDGTSVSYYPPSSDGTLWKVFEINNGNITPCRSNCMSYEDDSSNIRSTPHSNNEKLLFKNLPSK